MISLFSFLLLQIDISNLDPAHMHFPSFFRFNFAWMRKAFFLLKSVKWCLSEALAVISTDNSFPLRLQIDCRWDFPISISLFLCVMMSIFSEKNSSSLWIWILFFFLYWTCFQPAGEVKIKWKLLHKLERKCQKHTNPIQLILSWFYDSILASIHSRRHRPIRKNEMKIFFAIHENTNKKECHKFHIEKRCCKRFQFTFILHIQRNWILILLYLFFSFQISTI